MSVSSSLTFLFYWLYGVTYIYTLDILQKSATALSHYNLRNIYQNIYSTRFEIPRLIKL
jgi:hypothetical protein